MTGFGRSVTSYAMPLAALAMAVAVRASGLSVDVGSPGVRILVGALSSAIMFITIFVVLEHAEAVARRVGEPYGTLVLTFAVTAIEVSIIVSMMLHGENNPTLARESVFSTVMITSTGVVGTCLVLGGWRHRKQAIVRQGTSAYLAVLVALTVMTLVLPTYTRTTDPGTFSAAQLGFVSVLSVLLYAAFVFAQTVRHREDFIEAQAHEVSIRTAPHEGVYASTLLLFVGLIGIVMLAEQVAASVEDTLVAYEVTQADSIVGALIAGLVLMPEAISAVRASLNNELQRGLNVAMGSACATIGLTIPAVAAASLFTGRGLTLGLPAADAVLMVLALFVCSISFSTERTTFLTGMVHVVVFFTYVFLIFVP
ncbi:ionic transporter [Mesorhizobium sp. M4B.F.Ca.ET.190.01.1.1]|uniref:calcium:proton antiporter n=3 Tax=Mesorhizobium TaxID=68287 RepID=UPI000FE92A43|nr:calcium:proton antiporter [Mesorhizobium sp.]TGQ27869.1 ionic transporter [Mesorhizobium sp. M4B.F.Ca.ET.214.01.1.1]TGQ54948.1 ionic transporter [Mesorhizobium sp. M4B.F.Ca.ET.211.01.1.1]TGQ99411.1 ionic transporter [Mesorhizobium sp. M4B.F.Ca.ET.200.01.1.1]TGS11705.1 ionic transporter [Mesorhizobium sp. M4B.F.Ca.ET.190.01.1.1]TGT24047.1 ionic transporter [Mesorhizobium sp. M4B.F.Ca.ET.172.01.1.1]TGU28591.1 ionic transporter [Mesorhizobium sp. M4B.F.Ca.ET.150.01.1.1]